MGPLVGDLKSGFDSRRLVWRKKMTTFRIINGDSIDELKNLEPCSIDSLITDPPSGIKFMGNEWDSDKGGRSEWIDWLSLIVTGKR